MRWLAVACLVVAGCASRSAPPDPGGEPVVFEQSGVEVWDEWVLAPNRQLARSRAVQSRAPAGGSAESWPRPEVERLGGPGTIETEHFAIASRLEAPVTATCAHDLERAWQRYSDRFGPAGGPRVPVHLVPSEHPESEVAGDAHFDGSAIRVEWRGRGTLDRATLLHEAFHAYASRAFVGPLSPFLGEGLAESAARELVGVSPGARAALAGLLRQKSVTGWGRLLGLSYEEFHDLAGRATWGVRTSYEAKHYLLAYGFAETARRRPAGVAARLVGRMLAAARAGRPPEEALGRVSDGAIDAEWRSVCRDLIHETSDLELDRDEESPRSRRPLLSDEVVVAGLARARERRARSEEEGRALVRAVAAGELTPEHATLEGWRIGADLPLLPAFESAGVHVAATFRADPGAFGSGRLEVVLRRDETGQPLSVAIPPGSFGSPAVSCEDQARYFHEHDVVRLQPAAILEPTVAVFGAGDREVVVALPIACAELGALAPRDGQRYRLVRAARGSDFDRLLRAVAAMPGRDPVVAQLATWLVRDDPTWETYVARGGAAGFVRALGAPRSVLPDHVGAATEVLMRAGIDPRTRRFFGARFLPNGP